MAKTATLDLVALEAAKQHIGDSGLLRGELRGVCVSNLYKPRSWQGHSRG